MRILSEAELNWHVEHDLILRLLALRRRGRIGIILVESGAYYLSDGPYTDVWGSKVRYSKPDLLALVEALEAQPERRGMGREECTELISDVKGRGA